MSAALEALLVVQEHDLALDRLAHRRATLPERAAIAELMSQLMVARMTEEMTRIGRDELLTRQSGLGAEATAITKRVVEIERRLYGGSVSASRELAAMAAEVQSLERRRSEVEDRLLAVMEETEPVEAALAEASKQRASLEAEQARQGDALAAAELIIEAEAEVERATRQAAAAAVPTALAERYEQLRARLGGVGAAKLNNGSCGGCHLALPSAERERLRHLAPDGIATCDQCGRILVP